MGADKQDGLAVPGHIVLAHEPCFRIGNVGVDPPTRQIVCGERSETLEPRVMQVLVALSRADGRVVSRDELADLCWGGRIVGNDALNRVISRIRHLAGDIGGGTFKVQTIARVGYRLNTSGPERRAFARPPHSGRRKVLLGSITATAIAALGGGAAWLGMQRGAPAPREATLLFDRAEALRATGFAEDNRQAIAYLRRATRIAPEYASAWGALALAYSNALAFESPDRVEGFAELRDEAVRRARSLNPDNSDAAAAQMPIHYFGRWSQSERLYGEVLRRHPASSPIYHRLGHLLMDVGRWSDAVGALAAAKSGNASSPIIRYRLSVALWSAGRISEADREIDQALDQWPQHGAIWQTKVKLMALTGRPRMALAFIRDSARRPMDEDDQMIAARVLFLTALATGTRADAAVAIDSMRATVRATPLSGISTAINCARLGYLELAQDLLDGALLGTGEWAGLRATGMIVPPQTHPLFQPHASSLWPDARFAALLSRIGLERYWASIGRQPDFRRRDYLL